MANTDFSSYRGSQIRSVEHNMPGVFPYRPSTRVDDQNPKLVEINDDSAEKIFKSLSSESARSMFDLLYEEPQTASDIAKSLDMSVQNAKYHLDKLEEAGLIEIIDIWYSDRGREMNVYAPTSSSIILFAGNSNEKRSLRKILKQSLGITGILGIASFLFGWVLSNLRPETIVDTDTDPSNPVLVEGVIQQFTHVVLRGSESVSTGDLLTASERSERAGQGGPEGADAGFCRQKSEISGC
ncbi:ArsR/SmtB family transcription factor [Halorubrum lacusprofundi]|nr:helix-turn-helix domain-containing protein [Halorubrum lacusprofundi]